MSLFINIYQLALISCSQDITAEVARQLKECCLDGIALHAVPAMANLAWDEFDARRLAVVQRNSSVYGVVPKSPTRPEYVGALRRLMKSSTVTFNRPEQSEMIDLVHAQRTHGLVVLPTGGGKTLSILIPPLIENKGMSIVICPLVALFTDMQIRMERYPGIKWDVYPHARNDIFHTRVVFIPVEIATTEECIEWMKGLAAGNVLMRIFIDEAHLALTQKEFRNSIKGLFRLSAIRCPIIGLTGTLPPSSKDAYARTLGLIPESVKEVRAACTAPLSLRYELERVAQKDLLDKVEHATETDLCICMLYLISNIKWLFAGLISNQTTMKFCMRTLPNYPKFIMILVGFYRLNLGRDSRAAVAVSCRDSPDRLSRQARLGSLPVMAVVHTRLCERAPAIHASVPAPRLSVARLSTRACPNWEGGHGRAVAALAVCHTATVTLPDRDTLPPGDNQVAGDDDSLLI